MSTTVTYKGNTVATVSNATGTLKTAGKYLEGDVILTDVSGGRIWKDENGYVHLSDDGNLVGVEPLTVTENGTYTAPTGKAYSPIFVNAPSGVSNVAIGEFTASTAGTVQEISVNYSGNGWPIMISIYPKDGYFAGTSLYDTDHQYAIVEMSALNYLPELSPTDYPGYGGCLYKSQATGQMVTATRINGARMFGAQTNPTSSADKAVMIRDKNGFAVFVSDTSYGFLSGQTYQYVIVYSS